MNRIKRLPFLLLCFIILLSVTGCSQNKKTNTQPAVFSLEGLLNDDGIYEYPDFPVGMSKSEVEKELGFSLGEPQASVDGIEVFPLEVPYTYGDWETEVSLEFNSGGLTLATFTFASIEENELNTIEELCNSMAQGLKELYGEPTHPTETQFDGQDGTTIYSSGYRWFTDSAPQSTLQLVYLHNNEAPIRLSSSVGLYILPEE